MNLTTVSFSGHQSFPFRHAWLTKGVRGCDADSSVFGKEDAMVTFGVGKNMVQSIRHWCLATKMLEEDSNTRNNRGRHLRPSPIGRKLFIGDDAWDPYLEDTATLWLIHWLLTTNGEKATTWYYAFNLLNRPDFTRKSLEQGLVTFANQLPNTRASQDTLRRDVDIFIRTYVGTRPTSDRMLEDSLDCPLVELGLIYDNPSENQYAFARGPKDSLPDAVMVFALADYARRNHTHRSFTFDEIAYSPLGPGRVFRLDEASLADRLESLGETTNDAWQFTETAGYKQVLLIRDLNPMDLLSEYYRGQVGGKPGGEP